jgi:hypothetical protein
MHFEKPVQRKNRDIQPLNSHIKHAYLISHGRIISFQHSSLVFNKENWGQINCNTFEHPLNKTAGVFNS